MATWLVIEGMLINATNEQLNAEPLLTKGSWLWEVKGRYVLAILQSLVHSSASARKYNPSET